MVGVRGMYGGSEGDVWGCLMGVRGMYGGSEGDVWWE